MKSAIHEMQAEINKAAVQEQMRSFDTHAPLKTAKEVCATAHALRIQTLMRMAVELDDRGVEALINCATFHRRYPKGA